MWMRLCWRSGKDKMEMYNQAAEKNRLAGKRGRDFPSLMAQLTTEEKAALVSGTNFMYTNPIPRLGIPALCMADGPHGVRKQSGKLDNGSARSEPATAFPTAVSLASSWNPQNAQRMGEAIAAECRHYGVGLLLGPGVNVKRNPLCGRNFEYFSEDPLLAGTMAAAQVRGLQSRGVGASVKHFALNNNEDFRFVGDSVADLRAVREIYLRPFERIVREARPAALMCAYNQINGSLCSENRWLLTDVLRGEWGFDGAVMTDWGAVRDRNLGLEAGLDLEMPGDTAVCRRQILDGVADGSLKMEDLDRAVERVLRLVDTYADGPAVPPVDFAAHHALAAEIAADGAVLLENDGVLPLNGAEKVLVVGELFEKMRYQGAGSSMICPVQVTTPRDAFDRRGVWYEYLPGGGQQTAALAVSRAAEYNTVLIFAGLTDAAESEGCDRRHMRLPEDQLALIEALCETGKKLVLVLFGGSVVELPFAGRMSAVLHMFLPGQNGGTAAAELLFGDKSPAGRLAETWPISYEDVPFGASFGRLSQEVYWESVYVGYRYYLTAGKRVRYPFGYGLSYARFQYGGMELRCGGDAVTVSCQVQNTGKIAAAEVVQLYTQGPEGVFKPKRELRGFQKVHLEPGETKTVSITVPLEDLRYFHIKENRWVLEGGGYRFQLCSDCETVQLEKSLPLAGEEVCLPETPDAYRDAAVERMTEGPFEAMSGLKIPAPPPRLPLTMESRFSDFRLRPAGRVLYAAAAGVAGLQLKLAMRLPEGPERDNRIKGALFTRHILESNSLRSISMSAGPLLPWNVARGAVELANGHPLKALAALCKRVRVPRLPKAKG